MQCYTIFLSPFILRYMKAQLSTSIFHMMLFCSICIQGLCQQNEDSLLLANSEKWKVKQNKGLFGLAKPQFGPYTTIDVGKANEPTIKKKIKEGSEFDAEISGEGTDMDVSKYLTINKTKSYKILLAEQADTIKATFAISSVSKEKRQTFLGKMLSKNDEGKDAVLSYNRDVAGVITTGANEKSWTVIINNYSSGSRITEENGYPYTSISGAYLKSDIDSLAVQTYSSFGADLILTNSKGEPLAALKYAQSP